MCQLQDATTLQSSLFQLIELPGCPLPYVIVVASVYQPVKGTPLRSDPVTSAGVALMNEDIWASLVDIYSPIIFPNL